ncbi:MAG: flagellar export chaperone FlgN [Leptospiraceae bacterium]|nr:flagellar export chaperone FlgN [Leptospiraceae bacterium]
MLQLKQDAEKDLEYIFKEEISVYKSLLLLEGNKKESILKSDGKELESATKQISHLLSVASEVEKRRKRALEQFFADRNILPESENIILSEFLSKIEEERKSTFVVLAEDLRKVVLDLRDIVLINEKLLQAKQEIFQLSMEALKVASGSQIEVSYEGSNHKLNRPRTSVILNAKA